MRHLKKIKESTEWLSKLNDKEYPLEITKYRKEQQLIRAKAREMDSLLKLSSELNISYLPQDSERINADKDKAARYNNFLKNLKKDIYLDQAVKVIGDINTQRNLVKSKSEKPVKTF